TSGILTWFFENGNKTIARSNRLLVAAFSTNIEQALLKAPNGVVTLDFDPVATGISEETLVQVIDYMYTGSCRFSQQLQHAATFLGCNALVDLLNSTSEDGCDLHDEWHEIRFQEQLARFRKESKFLDCNIVTERLAIVRCHRLVMCAHSANLETALMGTSNSGTVTLRIDSRSVHISTENMKMLVDFAYTGVLDVGQRRFRMLRLSAFEVGMNRLVDLIDHCACKLEDEEKDLNQYGVCGMNFSIPVDENASGNPSTRHDFQHGDRAEDSKVNGNSAPLTFYPEDITAQAADDYDSIYEEYVMGPRRGRRTTVRMQRNRYQPLVVRGTTVVSVSDGKNGDATVPAVTMSFLQENERRTSDIDSFGYGLPEIVGTSDVTVPLIVGDQRVMMEKPFKCPYCDHRSKEKSGLEKHIRCIHTGEAPYKCKYCNQSFKVQSNLVRHIRAHTVMRQEKLDAHVFREHLKMRELECTAPGCTARFWRHDRFAYHCLKHHDSQFQQYFNSMISEHSRCSVECVEKVEEITDVVLESMDVDTCIRENIIWQKLPEDIRVLLGNSQREYDKLVLEYSIKNQLRYKGNLVRHVKKSEETYYDMIIKYSESHLMLYPYHLADIIVKELRITPFNYYINIITDMIQSEKSYDSLPNFTAADAVRLLGIGRNQYIDLMNQNRSNRKFLRRNRPLRELLPQKPAKVRFCRSLEDCLGLVTRR
ncbi:zinc finger, C2H2 type, partial [Ostertagia ostertagi]